MCDKLLLVAKTERRYLKNFTFRVGNDKVLKLLILDNMSETTFSKKVVDKEKLK